MRLEKVSAELSKRQLERMDQEEKDKRNADVKVTLEKYGTGFKFLIRNHGKAKASDVWITLDSDGSDNPIIGSEYKEKIPIPFLNSGDEVSLTAAIYLESSGKYKLSARWINEDKTQSSEEFFVSV